jgi:hypothetical protein
MLTWYVAASRANAREASECNIRYPPEYPNGSSKLYNDIDYANISPSYQRIIIHRHVQMQIYITKAALRCLAPTGSILLINLHIPVGRATAMLAERKTLLVIIRRRMEGKEEDIIEMLRHPRGARTVSEGRIIRQID